MAAQRGENWELLLRAHSAEIATISQPSFRGTRSVSPESITPVLAMAHYVYLLASGKHGTLYVGVTNDIVRRGHEHRTKATGGFTSRYGVDKLVWFEMYEDAPTAIAREKELKKWRHD